MSTPDDLNLGDDLTDEEIVSALAAARKLADGLGETIRRWGKYLHNLGDIYDKVADGILTGWPEEVGEVGATFDEHGFETSWPDMVTTPGKPETYTGLCMVCNETFDSGNHFPF